MDWRIVAGLLGVGIVIGFVIRSSLGFLVKVAVVVVALTVFHVVSPDGIFEYVDYEYSVGDEIDFDLLKEALAGLKE